MDACRYVRGTCRVAAKKSMEGAKDLLTNQEGKLRMRVMQAGAKGPC